MTRAAGAALVLAALAGCRWDLRPASETPPPRGPQPLLSRDDQVRLVVFQDLLRRCEELYDKPTGPRLGAFYLCLWSEEGDSDPGEALMAAVRGRKFPLKKVSQCLRELKTGNIIQVRCLDKETHQPGCILWVGDLAWVEEDTAELEAGYWEGGLASGGLDVRVRWRNGHWEIQHADNLRGP